MGVECYGGERIANGPRTTLATTRACLGGALIDTRQVTPPLVVISAPPSKLGWWRWFASLDNNGKSTELDIAGGAGACPRGISIRLAASCGACDSEKWIEVVDDFRCWKGIPVTNVCGSDGSSAMIWDRRSFIELELGFKSL
jgi:hypothetical protein